MYLRLLKNYCILGPIGSLPAPGTCASGVTILLISWLSQKPFVAYSIALICIFVLALFAIKKTLHLFEDSDPSAIVIDEVVGMLITFWAVPISVESLIMGLCLFRLFDITKIAGVKYFEKFHAPWGIMFDDVWAGILSNALLQIAIALRLF